MPAEAIVWAISPPIVPAPTTAALNTNMSPKSSGTALGGEGYRAGFLLRLGREAAQRAAQRVAQRAADEEHVRDGAAAGPAGPAS